MAKRDPASSSELTTAAAALHEELQRFARLTAAIESAALNSEKNIERAARTFQEIAQCDERLGSRVKELVAAVSAARDTQQQQAQTVHARALELQKRTELLQELLKRYGALGEEAAELNALTQKVATLKKNGAPEGELTRELTATLDRLQQVAGHAQAVAQAAQDQQFSDLGRQAEALRQQLLSAHNKMQLLGKNLTKP